MAFFRCAYWTLRSGKKFMRHSQPSRAYPNCDRAFSSLIVVGIGRGHRHGFARGGRSIWGGMMRVPAPGSLEIVASVQQLKALRALGVRFDVKHENVQALIDAERQPSPLPGGDRFDDFFLDDHE